MVGKIKMQKNGLRIFLQITSFYLFFSCWLNSDKNFMKYISVLIVILIVLLDMLHHKYISIMNTDIRQLINNSFKRMEGSQQSTTTN